MDLSSQQLLAGKYKLIRRLGEGGMGCVWVAEQLHLDRQVAIKVIGNRILSEPSARERFETEARATARVESPHVVQVLDFDYTDEGQPFLVLELLVGETLEQRISREGALSLVDARELLKQTTHALSEAHAADIFHRDIKAENLFLVARDELFVKLLDFGIALTRDRASNPGLKNSAETSPIGTPLYMSPEQTMAVNAVDERSDLYSLAVSMYYALTAQFPFNAETLAILAFAQQREDFKMPSRIRPELGPAIDAFFVRALAFHPEDRFQTAEKLFEAFDRACDRSAGVEAATADYSSSPSMRASADTLVGSRAKRASRSRRSSIALIAVAVAGAGFFLAPRFMQTSVSQSLSKAAVWSASRIPSAKVAAAEEEAGDDRVAPPRALELSGATVMLPLHQGASTAPNVAAVDQASPPATTTAPPTAHRETTSAKTTSDRTRRKSAAHDIAPPPDPTPAPAPTTDTTTPNVTVQNADPAPAGTDAPAPSPTSTDATPPAESAAPAPTSTAPPEPTSFDSRY